MGSRAGRRRVCAEGSENTASPGLTLVGELSWLRRFRVVS
jgi:hypothetical protein